MLLIKNVIFYCISSQSRRSMEREKKRLPDLASYKRKMDDVIINIVCSLGNHKYFMLKCGGGEGNAKVIIFRKDTRFIKKKKIKKRNMSKNSPTMWSDYTIWPSNTVVSLYLLVTIFVNSIKITDSMIFKFLFNDPINTHC